MRFLSNLDLDRTGFLSDPDSKVNDSNDDDSGLDSSKFIDPKNEGESPNDSENSCDLSDCQKHEFSRENSLDLGNSIEDNKHRVSSSSFFRNSSFFPPFLAKCPPFSCLLGFEAIFRSLVINCSKKF